jgi:phage-related protein
MLRRRSRFPRRVKHEIGFAIYLAQEGDKAANAVPMVGFGSAKVLEVVINDDANTFRAVYTVKFAHAVYALHAFQKKSPRGSKTPRPDMNTIRMRLKKAEAHHKDTYRSRPQEEKENGHGA